MSKTYRHLPERRNHRHVITTLSRAQVVIAGAAEHLCSEVDTVGEQQ